MLGEVFRFELGYQLKRKSTWFFFVIFTALMVQLTVQTLFDSARINNYFVNAPYVVAAASIIGSFIGMMLTAGVAGDAASRDVQLRFAPLMYTTRVDKLAYLGGRFLAAFVFVALLMMTVPIGQWLALLLPGLEPELVGPFRFDGYALVYFSLLLPTAFITTALMFSAAVLARRPMAAFGAAAALFVSALFTNAYVAQTKGMWALGRLLDPFGFTVMTELSRTRTALQKGELLVGLEPNLLANRALWIVIACAVLAFAYSRFEFAHEPSSRRPRWRTRDLSEPLTDSVSTHVRAAQVALPKATQRFDGGARLRQLLAITASSFRAIVTGRGMLVVSAAALFLLLTGPEMMEHKGVPLVPVTGFIAKLFGEVQDFFGLVAPLMCVVYAGELVWREREAGLGPIVDATPLHDWVPLLGKGLGLGLAVAGWQAVLMLIGIATQLRMDHDDLQPLLWLQMIFGLSLPGHLLFAVAAIAVHVLVNQKFIGHLVALAAYGLILFGSNLGLEHHLLVYGTDPGWSYSDLRGFGASLGPVLWFKLYWAGWALLLAVVARLLWVRGTEPGWASRLALARQRLSPLVLGTATVAALVIVGIGGFIYSNTNLRNDYATPAQRDLRRVEYERAYKRYDEVPKPTLTATTLRIELYPSQSRATIDGRHVFVNRTSRPIDTLHVESSDAVDTAPLRFDRATTLLKDDIEFRHRIVKLRQPLQPGESLAMDFVLRFGGRGFSNTGTNESIAPKASHFEQDWLPVLGYQPTRELNDEGKRRQLGLPPRPEITPNTDVAMRHDLRGYERIRIDTTIGTAAGQTAVAPGRLDRSWSKGDRRYFRYATDTPIRNAYGIYSADYAVRQARWKDVDIRVYHHPAHAANVSRMVESVQASLAHYTATIGPYPASELTVVEAPGFGLGAHAHPTSIRITEGYSLMNPDADWRKVDFAFAVMAHEIGHQWWGSNQLSPARVAGAPFVSESLAWYSALGVVEKAKGKAHAERFLDVMREDYLTPRARDGVPLLEAVDWFTAYRVGPFSMVALREAIGDEQVNLALRRFMQKFGQGKAPLPTSLELYAELKAVTPPAQHELLADLFARNTFWDLRAKSATAKPVGKQWQVMLEVSADKVSVDRKGKETPRPLQESVEIGVYGPATDDAPGKTLYLRKHQLHAGVQQIIVMVPSQPATGGVDPRHVFIDTARRNNTAKVTTTP